MLHLLNSPAIQAKLTHDGGAIARLVRSLADDDALADELYLTFLSRFPSNEEREVATRPSLSRSRSTSNKPPRTWRGVS